jgi:uncharacterized protein (DUF427 family)
MKTPGPDHPLAFSDNPVRVRARFENHVIADTAEAVTLREAELDPVQYFPRKDVETGFLSQTEKQYTCPYKGPCVFYSMMINGDLQENVAWSYEEPYPAAERIRGRIAFYPDRVQVYEVTEAETDNRRADALVESWPAGREADTKAV